MKKSYKAKILLLPIIVALVTMLSIQFIERDSESELIHLTMFENLMIFVMTFFAIYLFTIIIVVPIDFFISKKLENKIITFILFNIIGLVLIGCINIWVFKSLEMKSLYLIFPLFSILSLLQFDSNMKRNI
ncbi:pilus assembly protein PilB [Bacillus obstructivus]|jgi:hypothetical protein|nr:pilus assembly protein PilB [Bacillus obstructivus]